MSYPKLYDPISLAYKLYTNENTTKQMRYATKDVPILGDFMRGWDNLQYANDYMKNRGVSWSDVKYPTKAFGAGGVYGNMVQPTLESVENLYKSESRRQDRVKNEYSRNLRNEHYRTAIDANNMRRAWYYARM